MSEMPYCKQPCAECPWRLDAAPGKFPASRYIELAHTAYDMAIPVFACHMSTEKKPVICAGYIVSQGAHNLSMRMARQQFDVRSTVPLHPTYRRLAIANGAPSNHPALRPCRDDGQRR